MADDDNTTTTTSAQQIMDLKGLFGAPLIATVDADLMAARQFVEFIEEYGFEPVEDNAPVSDDQLSQVSGNNHFGKLRMITFRYETKDLSGNTKYSVIHIPAISLVPLPILQVSDASFDFDVRILASTSSQPEDLFGTETEEDDVQDYDIKATLSPNSSNSDGGSMSLSANMKVNINMRQADIPSGISTIINVMDQSVYNEEQVVPADQDQSGEGM